MTYNYPEDGKFHTRFSELVRATDGQIDRLVAERLGIATPYSNDITQFGAYRHELLKDYIQEHGKLPARFGLELSCNPDNAEKHIAVEMFPNVVLHGTPDAFGDDWIVDFKTTTRGRKAYSKSKQTIFYAWLLSVYGYDIKKVYYLCELWSDIEYDEEGKVKRKILGYETVEKEISPDDFPEVRQWTIDRVAKIRKAVKERETNAAVFVR